MFLRWLDRNRRGRHVYWPEQTSMKRQSTNMLKNRNRFPRATLKIIALLALLAVLGLLFALGHGQEKANGTVLILELENSENVHQYWVFNPYIRTIEKCNAAAEQAIAEILASRAVPKDSKVTSWRCSFTPPENDK
jgi:predicted nucleic acid-binding Zn ribbon protein